MENISNLIAIDAHSHFNHGARHDPPESEIYRCDLEFLRRGYDAANIGQVCLSTFASVMSPEDTAEENEYLYDLVQKTQWLYQWVVIDPRQEKTFEQAKQMLKSKKCVGIKLDAPCHGYSIAEYGDKIFSFACENGAVVKMCPQCMELLPDFADKYPDLRLIVAHLGSVMHVDIIEKAKYGNIYTDTSGCASSNNNVVEYAISRVGSDRILFGTDTYAAGFQRGRIEYAPISYEDKVKILRTNVLKLIPKLSDKSS
ncbi:MAG: hypothetical protein DBX47_03470 [Clostridiales bacterium]|nr:MAG: hypothetical protein DBX47_03470 [Clostridiales bacterium]